MTVKQAIEKLKEMPQNVQIYFDCPYCGKANLLTAPVTIVLLTSKAP